MTLQGYIMLYIRDKIFIKITHSKNVRWWIIGTKYVQQLRVIYKKIFLEILIFVY
jgi:hypothetical protein